MLTCSAISDYITGIFVECHKILCCPSTVWITSVPVLPLHSTR